MSTFRRDLYRNKFCTVNREAVVRVTELFNSMMIRRSYKCSRSINLFRSVRALEAHASRHERSERDLQAIFR